MKKSLLIIGLFSLMMVLTSFNTPNETGGPKGIGTSTGGDYTNETGGPKGIGTSTGGDYANETGGPKGIGTSTGGD